MENPNPPNDLVLTPQEDILIHRECYSCGGVMHRVPGLFDCGQPVYRCENCGYQAALPPENGWECETCHKITFETFGDYQECLDCFCERYRPTLPIDQWIEKHLHPVFNPGCLGKDCPFVPEGAKI